ncbi:FkbM family methyltransferase [Desertibaculum subflavum]|uniref:FkbM family methyltransferase n=1 Tax=Desertibaculum subflavum TaxID=2268458 RepID=UPI000E65FF41
MRALAEAAIWASRWAPAGRWRLQQIADRRLGKPTVRSRTADRFLMELDTSDFIQRQICLTGTWDDGVANAVRSRIGPGRLFVDCGANVGFFSLLAASRGARVIAFEPNPDCAAAIRRNADLNGYRIDIRAVGLAAAPGTATLHIERDSNLGAATLRPTGGRTVSISLDTLDNQLGTEVPDLLKIDVEGAEVQLLEGARATLSRVKVVIMEVSEFSLRQLGSSKDVLFDIMAGQGFTATILSPVRRSNAATDSIYFQYDALFERRGGGGRPAPVRAS